MKNIFLLGLLFGISSCGILFDDPITRFWNNGIRPSEKEMNAFELCVKESEILYPKSIDQNGSKRKPHLADCMIKKGYW